MNGYPYPSRPFPGNGQGTMENMGGNGINGYDSNHVQSLDQIVSQNDKAENIRRRSMPVFANQQAQQQQMQVGSPDNRRLSMMNFGNPGDVDAFQFDMRPPGMSRLMRNNSNYSQATTDMNNDPIASDIGLTTQYQSQDNSFSTMAAPGSAYASPLHANNSLDMDLSPYPNGMSMDMDDSMNMMSPDLAMFPNNNNNQFHNNMMNSPVIPDFGNPMRNPGRDSNSAGMQSQDRFKHPSMSNTPETVSTTSGGMPSRTSSGQDQAGMRMHSRPQSEHHSSSKGSNMPTQMSLTSLKNQQPVGLDGATDMSKEKMDRMAGFKQKWSPPAGGFPSTMHQNPHMKTQFKNAYSSTGFDMLGILVRLS